MPANQALASSAGSNIVTAAKPHLMHATSKWRPLQGGYREDCWLSLLKWSLCHSILEQRVKITGTGVRRGVSVQRTVGIWVWYSCWNSIAFQEGKYKRATLQYKKIVSWLEHESGLSGAEEEKARSLRLAAHLNLAMCHLKLKEYTQALENCNKVKCIADTQKSICYC